MEQRAAEASAARAVAARLLQYIEEYKTLFSDSLAGKKLDIVRLNTRVLEELWALFPRVDKIVNANKTVAACMHASQLSVGEHTPDMIQTDLSALCVPPEAIERIGQRMGRRFMPSDQQHPTAPRRCGEQLHRSRTEVTPGQGRPVGCR